MSINNLIYNGPGLLPNYSLNVNDIEIDGNLLSRKNGENRNGYILQCYDTGRARFSAPPNYHANAFALVGINQTQVNASAIDTTFSFVTDDQCIDDSNFLTVVGDTITVTKEGVYLVIYKICRSNANSSVFAGLSVNDVALDRYAASAPISSSTVQYSSIYCAGLLDLNVNDVIKITRELLGPQDIPPALNLQPNSLTPIPSVESERCASYVYFLKIGA